MKKSHQLLLCGLATLGAGLLGASAINPTANSPLRTKGPNEPLRRSGTRIPSITRAPEILQLPTEKESTIEKTTLLRKTAGGTSLYGYMTAGHSGFSHGLYRFDNEGISLMWRDPLFTYENGYGTLQTAWYRNGNMCGFDHWFQYGYFWGQRYYELNFESGNIVVDQSDEDCIDNGWFINACYDSETDTVYGYGTDDEEESSTALFMKTSGATPFNYEIIEDYGTSPSGYNKQCVSMCYNPIDKNLYGINLNKQFVRIDKQTGNQTVLFTVPVNMGMYVTGLAYSPIENLYYWNCNYDNSDGSWGSDLYTIDASNGKFTLVEQIEGGDSFSVLFVVGDNIDSQAPRRPEYLSADFAPGSTTGTLTFRMPSERVSGEALSGQLVWKFGVDGSEYSDGNAAPGAEVTVNVSNLRNGEHTFTMTAASGSNTSTECSTSFYVGADRPKAPAQVILEEKNIRWSAVREGVNGGYIDPELLEYEVYLNGEHYTTTKRNSTALTLPAGVPVQKWQASVVAVCNNMRSNPGMSNTIVAGAPWQMPVDITCDQEMLELMTIVNGNNDDETWEYTDWDYGWYSGQVDAGSGTGDDWVILPAINFPDADRYYSFYMDCMKKANIYPDTWLEVCYGDYPDPAMMEGNFIMERFSPESRDYHQYGNPMFKVPEAGTYYIGIRCITNEKHLGCIIGNIRVEDNSLSPESPAAVADLTATAGAAGALEATVSFKMPAKTINGDAIPASTDLTAKVTGDNVVTVTGKPGSTQTATVRTVQGDNLISVVVDNGNIHGERATVNVYTGVSIPGSVKNLQGVVSPDMQSITMTWEPPTAETAGGYVDPATVDYYFAIKDPITGSFEKSLAGTGVTSGTFTLPSDWTQDIYQIGVATQNTAGSNGKIMALQAHLGPAWKLPFRETFEGDGFLYQPWVSYSKEGSNVSWGMYMLKDIATEWAGLTSVALVGFGKENTQDEGKLGLPRFSTKDMEDVSVRIKYWAGDQAANLSVLAAIYGMEESELIHTCTLLNTDDWLTTDIMLPAKYLNQDWVQLYLNAAFGANHNYCIIEELTIDSPSGVLMNFEADGSIAAGKGCIQVNGYNGKHLTVFTTSGLKVADLNLSGEQLTVAVEAGIYLVNVAGKTVKLVVR